MPGVTFESRTNDHAAGQRKPATIAAAIGISTFPSAIDATTGWNSSSTRPSRPAVHPRRPNNPIVQIAPAIVHGSQRSGSIAWANAGE